MPLIINERLSKNNKIYFITYPVMLSNILHIVISALAICFKASGTYGLGLEVPGLVLEAPGLGLEVPGLGLEAPGLVLEG